MRPWAAPSANLTGAGRPPPKTAHSRDLRFSPRFLPTGLLESSGQGTPFQDVLSETTHGHSAAFHSQDESLSAAHTKKEGDKALFFE